MNPDLLCRALAGIEPETSVDRFGKVSGIASRPMARGVLEFLVENNIGGFCKGAVTFSGAARLEAASLALRMGCDVEQVSKHLSWKDFEKLASEVLASFGYSTRTNVRLTKPRMEIDVVGVNNSGFALVVDCKHWKRNNLSSISVHSRRQAARAERLVRRDPQRISQAVPAILTLHAESVRFVAGIPVVPISQFRSFVMDVQGHLPEIYVVAGG